MSYRPLAAAAAAILALQGCAPKVPPPVQAAEDFSEGIAKTCTFSPAQPNPGGSVTATLTMTNDGWCAYRASEKPGQPFLLGLVRQRPSNGELLIRKLGGETRVEYTANPGFTGNDTFSVALRPQSGADATVQLTATVTQGAAVAPVPAAAAPEPTTPARRTTRTTRRSNSH